MRNLTCPHCEQTVPVPDELTKAHCVRCGQAFELETNIMAAAPPVEAYSDRPLGDGGSISLPDRWSSWEEFRANSPAVQRELMQLASRALPDMRRMNVQPVPEDAPPEMDGWGRPLATIRIPGHATLPGDSQLARIMLILLLALGAFVSLIIGVVLLFIPGDREVAGPFLGWGAMGIFLAGLLSYIPKPKLTVTLWVFEEGLFVHRYGMSRVAVWADVRDFEASMGTGRPVYWLTLTHDFAFPISVGLSPEVLPLMEFIEIRLSAAQLLRRLEAIWEGQPQRFGIVRLDRQGFGSPRFFARWSEVRRVVSDAQHLFVDWSGVSEWSSLRYRDVSFPYLVMAISHVMIDEHSRFPKADA